nr:MAG TPA: hypothetical protein [Bacteriophage sp.]
MASIYGLRVAPPNKSQIVYSSPLLQNLRRSPQYRTDDFRRSVKV